MRSNTALLTLLPALLVLTRAPSLAAQQDEPSPAEAVATEEGDPGTAPPGEEPRKIHLVAEGPPPPSRTFHRHDGFYVRTNLGFGPWWANINTDTDQEPRAFDDSASGTGIGFDLLIGGSPSPGLTLGGGFIGNWSFAAEFENDGEPVPDRDIQDGTLGVFIDGFPRDTGPWHFGALVGLAGVQINQDFVENTAGFGGAVFVGYDQWVAPDWAMGGLIRLSLNRTGSEEDGVNYTASNASLAFMFTALYH